MSVGWVFSKETKEGFGHWSGEAGKAPGMRMWASPEPAQAPGVPEASWGEPAACPQDRPSQAVAAKQPRQEGESAVKNALALGMLGILAGVLICGLLLGGCDSSAPDPKSQTYTVTFDLNGGNIAGETANRTLTVNSGGSAGSDMPAAPVKDGRFFGGWYTSEGDDGLQFTASTPVNADVTVYAKWTDTQQTYTVTFDADGGHFSGESATQTVYVNSGGSVGSDMPANPVKDGRFFGGWYTSEGGGGDQFTASTPVNADVTVYAKWTDTQQTYTVTFDLDGGKIDGDAANRTLTVNSGDSAGSDMPANPAMSGRAFDGWWTERDGGGSQFTASTPVNADMTVHAKWADMTAFDEYILTKDPYSDGYFAQTADFLPEGFAVLAGDQIEISFWIKTGTDISNFNVGIADWANGREWIAENWDNPQSFNADGQFHRYNWTATAQAAGPAGASPLVFQFVMDSVSESQVAIYVSAVSVHKRSSSYTVTFDLDGGKIDGETANRTLTVSSGGSAGSDMPSNPTKNGQDFDGWWTGRDGGGSQFTASTTVNADRTVYAKWSPETLTPTEIPVDPANPDKMYTVRWENADGTFLLNTEVKGGDTPVFPNADPVIPESLTWVESRLLPAGAAQDEFTIAKVYKYKLGGWTKGAVPEGADFLYTAKYAKDGLLDMPVSREVPSDIEGGLYVSVLVKVVETKPYKIRNNNGDWLAHSRVKYKLKKEDGTEVEFWKNYLSDTAMSIGNEGTFVGVLTNSFKDQPPSDGIGIGGASVIHANGQQYAVPGDGIVYLPANYRDYYPEGEYDYMNQGLPTKAKTGVLNGKVVSITDNMGTNWLDKNDDTQIPYSKRVTIKHDGGTDILTLSPFYISHKEMYSQIQVNDQITYHVHELAYKIGNDYMTDAANGNVFPEDVETYGNFVNDRDFVYKWATGDETMTGEKFVRDVGNGVLQLKNEYPVGDHAYYGFAYNGKASALKTDYELYGNEAFLVAGAQRADGVRMASADGAYSGGARTAKAFLPGAAAVAPKIGAFVRALEKNRAPRSPGGPERQLAAVLPKKYRNARGV